MCDDSRIRTQAIWVNSAAKQMTVLPTFSQVGVLIHIPFLPIFTTLKSVIIFETSTPFKFSLIGMKDSEVIAVWSIRLHCTPYLLKETGQKAKQI